MTSVYRQVKSYISRVSVCLRRRRLLRHVSGGQGLHLEGKIDVMFPEKLVLGDHVHLGADCYINCQGGVEIGGHTIISRRVVIYSYDHNFKTPTALPYDDAVLDRPVHIGCYVWIGMGAVIAPGTHIGDGAVIGMGTVVSGDIPDNAIVVGAKPRIIGYRNEEQTRGLAAAGCFYQGY